MHILRKSVCLIESPKHSLYLWFPLSLHDGGSGLRLNDGPDVNL